MRFLWAVGLAAAALGLGLGDPESGGGPDESLYVAVAREMDGQGAWLTPSLDGAPAFYKPPLLYWAQRLAFLALGPSVFAARLPVLLFALGAAALFAALAARVWGAPSCATAVLVATASLGWVRFGRVAMMDAPLVFMLTLAAWAAWRAAESAQARPLGWAGLAAAGAALLKGPAAAGMVVLLVVLFLGRVAPRRLVSAGAGLALLWAVLLGAPWYLASLWIHGATFWQAFIGRENLGKLEAPWTLAAQARVLLALFVFALPWTFFALPRRRELREGHRGLTLAAAWLLAVLVPVTVSSVKMVHWLLPALPALLLLALRPGRPALAGRATAVLLAAAALALAAVLRWPFAPAVLLLVGAGAAALLVAAVSAWRGNLAWCAAGLLGAVAATLGGAVPLLSPPVPALPDDGRPLYSRHLLVEAPNRSAVALWRPEALVAAAQAGSWVAVREVDAARLGLGALPPIMRWKRLARQVPAATVWEAWMRRDTAPLFETVVLLRR